MRLLYIWREGVLAKIAGHAFSMNPYSPPPNYTNCDNRISKKGLAWAKGYWWAEKNRTANINDQP